MEKNADRSRLELPRVIINSLPKAGTHLVAKLLDLAGLDDCGLVFDRQMLIGRGWWVRHCNNLRRTDGLEVVMGIDMPLSVPTRFVEEKFAAVLPGQYIKAHTGYTSAIISLAAKCEIQPIVVVRDPRDVIVSFVHFVLENKRHPLHAAFHRFTSREQCLDAAMNGGFFDGVYLENIRARCRSLDVWLDTPGIILVRFEDLIGAKGKGSDAIQRETIEKIFRGIGLQKPASDISQIAAQLHGPGRVTFRKGVVGEAKVEMTRAQLQRADTQLADVYLRWGYARAELEGAGPAHRPSSPVSET